MSKTFTPITGNLTQDPELKFTEGGHALCILKVAHNDRRKDGDDWVDDTSYYDVVCWRERAEWAAEVLEKGMGVVILGSMKMKDWETKEGEKRRSYEVTADDIGINIFSVESVERRKRKGEAGASPAPQGQAAGPKNDPF